MSDQTGSITFKCETTADGIISTVKNFIPEQPEHVESDHDNGLSDDEEDEKSSDSETTDKRVRKDVTAILPPDAEDYKMDHPNRGHALIFNHKKYAKGLCLMKREGTSKDRDTLRDTLQQLGFKVHLFKNSSVEKIKKVLKEYSEHIDHSDNDCILIAVLSHGKKGEILYAYDDEYKMETLWEPFTADNCPSLAGKPKIIISQACRGDKNDIGINLLAEDRSNGHFASTDAVGKLVTVATTYSIPTNADIILAAATADGYVAFRNIQEGAVFIKILCEELLKDPENREFINVLTRTNRRIAIEYESIHHENPKCHKMKQVSCFISMLTRNLYFKPKIQGPSVVS